MSSYIELKNISQSFEMNEAQVTLFEGLYLTFHQGQSYAITGPSGAGKSSLLMVASGLEQPASGQGHYVDCDKIMPLEQAREEIGFIFQQFHLLQELTALNNVALPLKLRGDRHAIEKAKVWLEKVGLSHRQDHTPNQLSGGEQQRVAIARALIFEPKFIFADEPTGNLDQKSADDVADILIACCKENNAGLVMVTHSSALASRAQQVLSLANNQLTDNKTINVKEAS
ncbi:ABC transporter ATP-binding protein [Litorilituus sediminis]|uniref:ABC transporter ATP-binding protein n=1 Tax=Litorilituus sediminis TaxID=718192 RepID=A0A4P6P206_9GAMM|nr:ABC transporter ATP-binding protein [Litorilituus sediminis]QBG35406.1 ABC transporter ATP-binding protein [Litorilituus sediminis]